MPRIVCWLVLALLPGAAGAHGLEAAGFLAGLAHPMGGADHLVAMVTVGLASTRGGRALVVGLPGAFLAGMAAGFASGLLHPGLAGVEQAIVGSLLVLLAMPAAAWLTWVSVVAVVGFGWCHGYAHGQEWPRQASALAFGAGFMGTSAGLHAIGAITGMLYRENAHPARWFAATGGLVAATGAVIAAISSGPARW